MADAQLRLLPAAQPLVERLGPAWFRALPTGPGVYRMHDTAGHLVYVGKAVNLRQRLSSYRRTRGQPRRIVRLIHSADRIEWESCESESHALRLESELIRTLQPRFNRAGKWAAPPLRVSLEWTDDGARIRCIADEADGALGPFPATVRRAAASLARLLWLALHRDAEITGMPHALSLPQGAEAGVGLPADGPWREWVADYFGRGDLAVAWELAERLEARRDAFARGYVRVEWESVAAFARRHPARGIAAG